MLLARIVANFLIIFGTVIATVVLALADLGPLPPRAFVVLGLMTFATGLAIRIRRPHVRGAILAGVAAVPLVLPAYIVYGKPFDHDQWMDKASKENDTRHAMADRFFFWGSLANKSQAEVRAMLGQPTYGNPDSKWLYRLGTERWYLQAPILCDWLSIDFENGHVIRCSTYTCSHCGD
jgi:hypothetical protein